MSLIIGIKKNNVVYLAADTQITGENQKVFPNQLNKNNFKIFKVKGLKNCYCGVTGSYSNMSIIKSLNFKKELTSENMVINYDFIVNNFIQKIIGTLISYKKIDLLKGDSLDIDNAFLLAQNDKLFFIGSDFSVIEVDTYFAIGSGSRDVQSILFEGFEKYDPEKIIVKALDFSSKIDLFVSKPFIIVDTAENKIKYLNENK